MKITEHTIHTANIKNNCPECFSTEGLIFSFTQEEKENAWYRKAQKQLKESLFCHVCHTEIYPVRWDEHIERVYLYNKKLVQPLSSAIHFKKRFWMTLLIGLLFIGGVIFWILNTNLLA